MLPPALRHRTPGRSGTRGEHRAASAASARSRMPTTIDSAGNRAQPTARTRRAQDVLAPLYLDDAVAEPPDDELWADRRCGELSGGHRVGARSASPMPGAPRRRPAGPRGLRLAGLCWQERSLTRPDHARGSVLCTSSAEIVVVDEGQLSSVLSRFARTLAGEFEVPFDLSGVVEAPTASLGLAVAGPRAAIRDLAPVGEHSRPGRAPSMPLLPPDRIGGAPPAATRGRRGPARGGIRGYGSQEDIQRDRVSQDARGVVGFAHDSGSGRHRRRDRQAPSSTCATRTSPDDRSPQGTDQEQGVPDGI